MTSTNARGGATALLATLALVAGQPPPGGAQPPREVDLHVRGGGDHYWKVKRDGDRFVAVRIPKGGVPPYYRNFRERGDAMQVDGKYLGRDPQGESKDLVARDRETADTKWDKPGARFGTGLRVPDGPLKGWWVGLGPAGEPKAGKRVTAPLVLVKDRKQAAVFYWADPDAKGP